MSINNIYNNKLVYKNKYHNHKGGALTLAIMAVAIVAILLNAYLWLAQYRLESHRRQVEDQKFYLDLSSVMENVVTAFNLAQSKYYIALGNCATNVRPFLEAMATGHGCAGVGDVTLFRQQDADDIGMDNAPFYAYAGSCIVHENTPMTCNGAALPQEIINVGHAGFEHQKINGADFSVVLQTSQHQRQISEWMITANLPGKMTKKQNASLYNSLANTAHLEADGRITQNNPFPLSPCPGEPWTSMRIYNPFTRRCELFGIVGSGTGLAFFGSRFFGHRSFDGQIIDLANISLSSVASYLVDEAGELDGKRVFPKYKKELLINVDDVTTINDQVYYVAKQGQFAEIGMISDFSGTFERVPLCPLGEMGWSQAYSGLAATGWSDPVMPSVDEARVRTGQFFLKTDGGDLLTVFYTVRKAGTVDTNCKAFNGPGGSYTNCCFVVKDANAQEVEFKRTYGFDRANPVKPYFFW